MNNLDFVILGLIYGGLSFFCIKYLVNLHRDASNKTYFYWDPNKEQLIQSSTEPIFYPVKKDYHDDLIVPFDDLQEKVLEWAKEKGILDKGTPLAQIEKTREEVEETRDALVVKQTLASIGVKGETFPVVKKVEDGIEDGLGDILVTIIILAHLCDKNLLDCLETAYQEIAGRKGQMVDGAFVKDE